jgi:sugar/nucleoside kinase (ribokinase family)
MDVVFAGEVFCDLVFGGPPGLPVPGGEVFAERFKVSPGGTANRCVASARLGLRTGLIGTVGPDMFGDHVAAALGEQDNLDLRWLRRHPTAHTPLTVAVANSEDRTFITYQEQATTLPELWEGRLPHARALHIGVQRPVPEWVTRMREAGTFVVGGVGWDADGHWSRDVLARLAQVDMFLPNAVEAMNFTRTASPEAATEALAALVPEVVVTDGPHGAVGFDRESGTVIRVPAPRVEVADPTGAGDVFAAAYLYGVLAGRPLEHRMRLATLAAACSVRTLGGADSAPTWAGIAAFLDGDPRTTGSDRELVAAAAARAASGERT